MKPTAAHSDLELVRASCVILQIALVSACMGLYMPSKKSMPKNYRSIAGRYPRFVAALDALSWINDVAARSRG